MEWDWPSFVYICRLDQQQSFHFWMDMNGEFHSIEHPCSYGNVSRLYNRCKFWSNLTLVDLFWPMFTLINQNLDSGELRNIGNLISFRSGQKLYQEIKSGNFLKWSEVCNSWSGTMFYWSEDKNVWNKNPPHSTPWEVNQFLRSQYVPW